MTSYDKKNVAKILAGEGTWFTAKLIRLIAGSDSSNRGKLQRVFPEEVEAVNRYQHGKKNEK